MKRSSCGCIRHRRSKKRGGRGEGKREERRAKGERYESAQCSVLSVLLWPFALRSEPLPSLRRTRRAFSLLEVVIALTILAMITTTLFAIIKGSVKGASDMEALAA